MTDVDVLALKDALVFSMANLFPEHVTDLSQIDSSEFKDKAHTIFKMVNISRTILETEKSLKKD